MVEATKGLIEARKKAAAEYTEGHICWRGIMSGQWDNGSVVQKHLNANPA